MASTYGRVRLGQARKAFKSAQRSDMLNTGLMVLGAATTFVSPVGGSLLLLSGVAGSMKAGHDSRVAKRQMVRAKAMNTVIQRSQRVKAASASIARARGVLAKTAAARSMAASRQAIPRPVGQRKPAAAKKRGDGQTEGYYRTQAGKRVFVKGYSTPNR